MMEEWKEVDLGEITIKIGSGVTPRGGASVYIEKGTTLFRSQNIYNGFFSTSGLVFITEPTALKMKNVAVLNGDILMNITGDSVARCCIAPTNFLPGRVNQHVAIIRVKENLADSVFLMYTLISPRMQSTLLSIATGAGATRNALTKNSLERLKIILPPLPTQRKIAHILSSYDDLIENNLKRIKLLEEKAQLTYEEWFVKMRFPGHETAVFNEETGLPVGWDKVKLGGIIDIVIDNRGKNPKYYCEVGIPVIDNHLIVNESFIDISKCKRYLDESVYLTFIRKYLNPFDVLITLVGNGCGSISMAPVQRSVIIQNTIGLRCNKLGDQYFLYWYLLNNRTNIKNQNRGSAQPSVKVGDLLDLGLELPTIELLKRFSFEIKPIFELTQRLANQNNLLKEARDILLPRLMSGLVNVEELEEEVAVLTKEVV